MSEENVSKSANVGKRMRNYVLLYLTLLLYVIWVITSPA